MLKSLVLFAALSFATPSYAIDTIVAGDEIVFVEQMMNACRANIRDASEGQASIAFVDAACNCVVGEMRLMEGKAGTFQEIWWEANQSCIKQSDSPVFIEIYRTK